MCGDASMGYGVNIENGIASIWAPDGARLDIPVRVALGLFKKISDHHRRAKDDADALAEHYEALAAI